MRNVWIVLVGSVEDEVWSVAVNTDQESVARSEYLDLKEDGTPAILFFTGDYVTV